MKDPKALIAPLQAAGLEAVLYQDINDPYGVALLYMSEDPSDFVGKLRNVLNQNPFRELRFKSEWTMLGRTYSSGREPNLEDWLLQKPRRAVMNNEWNWAIWYPLRRKPDISLAENELDWKPITNLEKGLKKTIPYFEQKLSEENTL